MGEANLWQEKRWIITTLLITYFAGSTIFAATRSIGDYFLGLSLPSVWIILALLLVGLKLVYMSYRHFAIYENASVGLFRWISDFVFVLVLYGLVNNAILAWNAVFLLDVELELITTFILLVASVYGVNLVWLIFRWFFQERDETAEQTNLCVENMLIYFGTAGLLIFSAIALVSESLLVLPVIFGMILVSTIAELLVFRAQIKEVEQAE